MKTITIKVTQEDIKNGYRCSAMVCPIALAAQRAGLVRPRITGWIKADGVVQQLPRKARTFINDFDTGKKVKPFEFKIRLRMPRP